MGGYSLPLKNRDMFRDLKKGFQVYTLDTSDVPVFRMGNVVNVSEPRFQQPQMGQMGQYQQLQDRVIDLTVEINGSSMTYVVPESRDVAMSNNITLACSVDPIMNQLNAAKRTSSDILDSIDKHRRTLEACDSILEEINPAFKQTKDQDRKIKNLEEKVDRMGSSFDELKELLIKKGNYILLYTITKIIKGHITMYPFIIQSFFSFFFPFPSFLTLQERVFRKRGSRGSIFGL